jgi:asparagine synthase (glutamine-hydrolysing)
MCGIIGACCATGLSPALPLDWLHHRGPDARAVWQSGTKVHLGHTRLAVIDLSPGGHQPQSDAGGQNTITFNGEIYNYQTLREELKEYPFTTQSDTEVILAAYNRWGTDCPKYLKGQFAFALWDAQKQHLFMARDRVGEKPFYYLQRGESFYFASEIRALLALTGEKPVIEQGTLQQFLYFQSVQAPHTLLQNIRQLPPAHSVTFEKGHLKFHRYWQMTPPRSSFDYSDEQEVQKTVREKLSAAVTGQMVSDVPLGAFLSGGIDSGAVVALMATQCSQPVRTFSIGFEEAEYDESPYARLVADKFHTDHTSIILKAHEFKERIPEILRRTDSPTGDGPNTFIVSEAVKKAGLTVALSGLGGDELFAGYAGFTRYYQLRQMGRLWQLSKPLRHLAASFAGGKEQALLRLAGTHINDFYPLVRRVFSPGEVLALSNTNGVLSPAAALVFPEGIEKLPLLSQYSVAELSAYTQSVLLHDTDQMAMASSLEVRVPFFDHELIEYVLGIPDAFKYPRYPKRLLVESLRPLLPEAIVHRPKMGFSFPWDTWLRTDLKPYCVQALEDLCAHNVLNPAAVQQLYKRYEQRDAQVKWSKIWLLVALEQWLKNIRY